MEEKLVNYFAKFQLLTEMERSAIRDSIEVLSVKKGDFLLKEGQIAKSNFFVLEGCVRQYYLQNGEENTSNFFVEESWILPSLGGEENKAVNYNLECLEDCHLVIGSDEKGEELIRQLPKFQDLARMVLEKEIIQQHTKFASYMNNSPEERYISLQNEHPDLLNRIHQYHLSSYIGVKPESLSRIRKRIASKG